MVKNICLIFKVIYSNDILKNRIMNIGNFKVLLLFENTDIFKISHTIIGNITKEAIIDKLELVLFSFKKLGKFLNYLRNIGFSIYFSFSRCTIGKNLSDHFFINLY